MNEKLAYNKYVLTITGSDSTGGSGVQADINTITALGGYAVSAITSITVQTSLGIQEFFDVPAEIVAGQIEAVFNDVEPQVVKVGLLRSMPVLRIVVDTLLKYKPRHIVYDPVIFSSRGELLISDEVVKGINELLLPLCTLIIDRKRYVSLTEHGVANGFSSAVAVFLGQGATNEEALEKAKAYINMQSVRSSGLQGRVPALYNDFIDAVAAHCHTNNDVTFYSNRLNISARYLAQVCRRIANKSPKTIIDEHLIKQIEVQLTTTACTIQEIAYAFGFSSQAHFTRFFKKMKGCTPTRFRAEH